MKLFSFLKKQKEAIDINVPEVPVHKSSQVAKDEEIYFERVEFGREKYSLNDCKTVDDKKEFIERSNKKFEQKSNSLFHTYNFLRLFSRSADKDNKFNEKMMLLDKQINRMKKMHEDIKRRIELIKYMELQDSELENINFSISELFAFYRDIESDIEDLKQKYYKHIKMTSFSICNDKSYQELDAINKNINKIVDEYKNITDAYDYVFFNSGSLIVDTINALVECLLNSNNKELKKTYTYEYFLNSTYVVALSFPEWVELFTKIKYVMRVSSKVELFDYLKFKDLYIELEKRYILMLIYNEIKK